MKNLEEYRSLDKEELEARLADAEEELANLRFQLGGKQLENQLKVRIQRRNVAQLRTLIREKELGINQLQPRE